MLRTVALQAVIDNEDGALVDARGNALPPCIVMEKGESLDLWVKRNRRAMDPFTCMQARTRFLRAVKVSVALTSAACCTVLGLLRDASSVSAIWSELAATAYTHNNGSVF